MAGVVHGDHRPEELPELRRQVGDVDALTRTEPLRMTTGLDHVSVSGDCPVARPGREEVVLHLGEEPDGVPAAERSEPGVAVGQRAGPERVHVGEVDFGKVSVGGSHRPEPTRCIGLLPDPGREPSAA